MSKWFISGIILLTALASPSISYGLNASTNKIIVEVASPDLGKLIPLPDYVMDEFSPTQDVMNGTMLAPLAFNKKLLKRKIIAVSLAVTLGVFGVHRLYLGTSTKVPIIYTLTLGGGFGVLVVSDIIAIIASKDLDEYSSEEKVFMWAK